MDAVFDGATAFYILTRRNELPAFVLLGDAEPLQVGWVVEVYMCMLLLIHLTLAHRIPLLIKTVIFSGRPLPLRLQIVAVVLLNNSALSVGCVVRLPLLPREKPAGEGLCCERVDVAAIDVWGRNFFAVFYEILIGDLVLDLGLSVVLQLDARVLLDRLVCFYQRVGSYHLWYGGLT